MRKNKVVDDWPLPKTVKDVRKFLGYAGYFRRFIKGFSAIARPLNNLLNGHPLKCEAPSKKKQRKHLSFGLLKNSKLLMN